LDQSPANSTTVHVERVAVDADLSIFSKEAKQMKKNSMIAATLLVAAMASMTLAGDVKKKAEPKGEKPKASPGWVVIEEDWSYPFLDEFSTKLHSARAHYRAKEDKSASAEIDKAISWLQYAEGHADKATAEDLSTARYDLMDISASLKSGKPVLARKLDNAFAFASMALGKHHHFRSGKALAESDLKSAGQHLMAATDLLRNAAQSANSEYGSEIVDIDNSYAPFGYWDDTIVLEKSKLESNLTTVKNELEKLAGKLKSGR
jgi:hypothetical protein